MATYREADAYLRSKGEDLLADEARGALAAVSSRSPEIAMNVTERERRLPLERFSMLLRDLAKPPREPVETRYESACNSAGVLRGDPIAQGDLPAALHRFIHRDGFFSALAGSFRASNAAEARDAYYRASDAERGQALSNVRLTRERDGAVCACFSRSPGNSPGEELGPSPDTVADVLGLSGDPGESKPLAWLSYPTSAVALLPDGGPRFPTVADAGWNERFRPAPAGARWGMTRNRASGVQEVPAPGIAADRTMGLPEVVHGNRDADCLLNRQFPILE